MTVYQKLVLKALSAILLMVSSNRPRSNKDIDDSLNVMEEIKKAINDL